jgi:hypothetical protein
MKSADLRDRNDAPARGCLDFPRLGAVAIERLMRAGGVVVREVSAQQASEMLFVDHDDEIESFAANGADDALGEGVLPGRVHVLILGERHLRRTLARYFAYYHQARTHLSLDKDAPHGRSIERPELGKVIPIREVGGLHHRYIRRAA